MNNHSLHTLRVKNLGIDTYRENIIFMRADCHVCISECFKVLTRVIAHTSSNKIIATLNVVYSDIIGNGEIGLSIEAMKRLGTRTKINDYLSLLWTQKNYNEIEHQF